MLTLRTFTIQGNFPSLPLLSASLLPLPSPLPFLLPFLSSFLPFCFSFSGRGLTTFKAYDRDLIEWKRSGPCKRRGTLGIFTFQRWQEGMSLKTRAKQLAFGIRKASSAVTERGRKER